MDWKKVPIQTLTLILCAVLLLLNLWQGKAHLRFESGPPVCAKQHHERDRYGR